MCLPVMSHSCFFLSLALTEPVYVGHSKPEPIIFSFPSSIGFAQRKAFYQALESPLGDNLADKYGTTRHGTSFCEWAPTLLH